MMTSVAKLNRVSKYSSKTVWEMVIAYAGQDHNHRKLNKMKDFYPLLRI